MSTGQRRRMGLGARSSEPSPLAVLPVAAASSAVSSDALRSTSCPGGMQPSSCRKAMAKHVQDVELGNPKCASTKELALAKALTRRTKRTAASPFMADARRARRGWSTLGASSSASLFPAMAPPIDRSTSSWPSKMSRSNGIFASSISIRTWKRSPGLARMPFKYFSCLSLPYTSNCSKVIRTSRSEISRAVPCSVEPKASSITSGVQSKGATRNSSADSAAEQVACNSFMHTAHLSANFSPAAAASCHSSRSLSQRKLAEEFHHVVSAGSDSDSTPSVPLQECGSAAANCGRPTSGSAPTAAEASSGTPSVGAACGSAMAPKPLQQRSSMAPRCEVRTHAQRRHHAPTCRPVHAS
mmetsp:Transcript_21451/g.54789  ORF Transcript_21451/g.54789 Transcript_21451/m.54789 type:complete len:356 (+) Transcript_21451:516-1583(+)